MTKHLDLNEIDLDSSSLYDKVVSQERWYRRQDKKNKKRVAKEKAHQNTTQRVTPYQTRPCTDFSPYHDIFTSIRKLMSDGELLPVKIQRSGKNASQFAKQEFYLMNEQLVYIADKFEQYADNDEFVEYIHAVNEDKNEILQPLSVFKALIGHMPKIEQIQFASGKPALHAPNLSSKEPQ